MNDLQIKVPLCLLFILTLISAPSHGGLCEQRLIALKNQNLVKKVIPGIYESIPSERFLLKSLATPMWAFKYRGFNFLTSKVNPTEEEKGWDFILKTKVFDEEKELVGTVERFFTNDLTRIHFAGADLNHYTGYGRDVPSFIRMAGVVPLVPLRGNPTQDLITWVQMKIAGVPYGGLKFAETGPVDNMVTSLELFYDPSIRSWLKSHHGQTVPNELVAKAILGTSTGRYLSTILTQSGHHIDKIVVTETSMESRFSQIGDEVDNNPYLIALRKNLSNSDRIPIGFNIHFTLSPARSDR